MFRCPPGEDLELEPQFSLKTPDQDFGVVCEPACYAFRSKKHLFFLSILLSYNVHIFPGHHPVSQICLRLPFSQDYGAYGFMFDIIAPRRAIRITGLQICSADGTPRDYKASDGLSLSSSVSLLRIIP
jgi:hypothetical protein